MYCWVYATTLLKKKMKYFMSDILVVKDELLSRLCTLGKGITYRMHSETSTVKQSIGYDVYLKPTGLYCGFSSCSPQAHRPFAACHTLEWPLEDIKEPEI